MKLKQLIINLTGRWAGSTAMSHTTGSLSRYPMRMVISPSRKAMMLNKKWEDAPDLVPRVGDLVLYADHLGESAVAVYLGWPPKDSNRLNRWHYLVWSLTDDDLWAPWLDGYKAIKILQSYDRVNS